MTAELSPATVLRPVNHPRPLTVAVGGDGEPYSVTDRGRPLGVTAILDRWRVDDEWWRVPIARLYYRLVLADVRLLTLYHDLETGRWYAQRYRSRHPRDAPAPLPAPAPRRRTRRAAR